MKYLYLLLNLGSFIIPFIFSFHPKLQFYKRWPGFSLGILVMMFIFIPWDIIFTNNKIWGFNEAYISGIYIFNLPLEEWLFFVCIPYACIFTHYSLQYFFPKFVLAPRSLDILYFLSLIILIITLWYAFDKWYTLVNFSYAIILLGIIYNKDRKLLAQFFPTFLIILIPFFLVNGILTGSFIDNQVVWYDNSENLGIRLGTIPIEDTVYALSMLLTVLFLTDRYGSRRKMVS